MTSTQHLPFLLSLLLSSSLLTSASGNPEAHVEVIKEVVVEGMVYCQSCTHAGSWSLEGARPLPSAKVGIACKDRKNRVRFYKAFRTDGRGYFYARLQGKGEPVGACAAHLLSSPDRGCGLLTNINYGIDGAPLRYENKTVSGRWYEAAIYAAGPLAFRPDVCPPTIQY